MRRNRSHGDFVPQQYLPSNGSCHTLGRQNSLKNVQLQLANYDHENNLLNSKPMPKKILPPQHYSQFRNGGTIDCNGNRKELRRAATMSTIAHAKLMRQGSERSYSTQSSDHLSNSRISVSPGSGPSRGLGESTPNHRPASGALWGKVRHKYAPSAVTLGNEPPMPKLATFTQLWDAVFEIVKENGMLELDEPDPRLWWRKVLANLRNRHGKGKTLLVIKCVIILQA